MSFGFLLCATVGATSIGSPGQANPRLTTDQFDTVAAKCASSIEPGVLAGLVHVESRFHPYAIGVGGNNPRSLFPDTREEAISAAYDLIANGERFDAGLGQINVQNFEWLDLTIEDVFDICVNLQAAEKVLRHGYDKARADGRSKDKALEIALSIYNSGHSVRGVTNGYVARVIANAGRAPISTTESDEAPPKAATVTSSDAPPRWDVYGTAEDTSSVAIFK